MSDNFGKNRNSQHKPTREERHSKDIQELRAENRKLRKQITRLRKELQKVEEIECPVEESETKAPDHRPKCIGCGSVSLTKPLTMPSGKIIFSGQSCGQRTVNVVK